MLWANLHLLFWLSLVPVVTSWIGETGFAAWPVAIYGLVLLLSAVAYYILSQSLIALHGQESTLGTAVGADFKGRVSIAIYVIAIGAAFVLTWLSVGLYVAVAIMWLIPDQRIEKTLKR